MINKMKCPSGYDECCDRHKIPFPGQRVFIDTPGTANERSVCFSVVRSFGIGSASLCPSVDTNKCRCGIHSDSGSARWPRLRIPCKGDELAKRLALKGKAGMKE